MTWYCRTRGRSHKHGYGACMRQEEEEEEEGNERARSRGRGGASGAPWLVMRELTLEREHRGWPKRRAKVMMCQDDDRPRCKAGNRDSTLSSEHSEQPLGRCPEWEWARMQWAIPMAVSGTTTQLHLHERTHVLGLGTWGEGGLERLVDDARDSRYEGVHGRVHCRVRSTCEWERPRGQDVNGIADARASCIKRR